MARFFLILTGLTFSLFLHSQETVKNLIVMIPDGTSSSILSLARWYKFGPCVADHCRLAIDPHICGLLSTYNSDSPIGDSAPTGSAFATGYLSNSGFVATYPVSSPGKDLFKVDQTRSYQPLFTILEAAAMQGKSTGLVVTCHFPHATPADFSAHTPDRDDMDNIARQMVHNKLNVVFGGGLKYLDPAQRKDGMDLFNVLRTRNYQLVTTRDQFDALAPEDTLVYGLFAEKDLPYDLDRNSAQVPSLAEMTRKAIKSLSQNPNGFFLMVEGSKIDWAAHTNDAAGIITEFLAFDDAVKEAMDFANKDGYTAVVIMPDHGNSGISLGNSRSEAFYDEMDIHKLIDPLKRCTASADALAKEVAENPPQATAIFAKATGIDLTASEEETLARAIWNKEKESLPVAIATLISNHTYVGFTTHGHTGEDVMLAVYHPGGVRPTGVVRNTDLNKYMLDILAIPSLDSYTDTFFCIDTVACKPYRFAIQTDSVQPARLAIELDSKKKLFAEIIDGTDYITVLKKGVPVETIPLPSLALYVKPLNHFFLPAGLASYFPGRFLK